MRTFKEIQTEVASMLGFDLDSMESKDKTSLKLFINSAQEDICSRRLFSWLIREKSRYLFPKYIDGTISTTIGSKTVTGVGTAFSKKHVGQLIVFDDNDNEEYKIASVSSATSLTLDREFVGENAISDGTYTIANNNITLERDFRTLIGAWTVFNGCKLEIKQAYKFRELYPNPTAIDSPGICYINEGLTRSSLYNTGTVTLVNKSTTVTGSGTTWTSAEFKGKTFRVKGDSYEYEIASVDSTTQITLTEKYKGESASGKDYDIDPAGSQQLMLFSAPEDENVLMYRYYCYAPRLIDDEDISIIPSGHHIAIIMGAYWRMAKKQGEHDTIIVRAKQDYEQAITNLVNEQLTEDSGMAE